MIKMRQTKSDRSTVPEPIPKKVKPIPKKVKATKKPKVEKDES